MSDDKEKGILRPNQDGGSSNSETLTEGNVLSLESNENTEYSSSKIENLPRSGAIEGSGDSPGRNIVESNKSTEKSSTVSEHMPQTAAIGCSGDSASRIAQEKKIRDKLEAGLKIIQRDFRGLDEVIRGKSTEVPTRETNVVTEGGSKENVPFDELEDEDMQLRWDEDDDASNPLDGDNNANVADTNNEINSAYHENVTLKDTTKESETSPKLDVLSDKTVHEVVTLKDTAKEPETDPELDVHSDKTDLESVTLKDTAEESETGPELGVHTDKTDFESVTLRDTAKASETGPELDIHTDMTDLESVTLKDTAEESETGPELDIHTDKTDLESVTLKDTAKASETGPELDVHPDMTDLESVTLKDTAKESETSPELDVHSDKTVHESVTLKDTAKESETDPELGDHSDTTDHESVTLKETAKESETSPELDIHIMTDHEKSLEDELLEENDVAETVLSAEEKMSEAKEIINIDSFDKVINKSKIITEEELGQILDALNATKSKDEQKKVTEQEDLLSEALKTASTYSSDSGDESPDYRVGSPDSTDGISDIITVKDEVSSDNIPKKDFPFKKEVDDDILLEEKLLAEPETTEVIPESDVAMDIDDDNEAELLKDDDGQSESCTPMDVDSTDPSIEDQVNIENKVIDQPIDDESEIRKKEIAQTESKTDIDQTTDEIKGIDETDAQLQITKKIIDQPVEDTAKTVEVIKDIPIQEKSESVEFNKETATENQAKIDEKTINIAVSETENVNQPMNDKKKMDENSKVQLIEEKNTTEDSIKTPEQSDAVTVSDILNIEIEAQEKSIPDQSTLVKEMGSKNEQKQPKLNTESVCKDINIEIPEKSKEIDKLDSTLDKNSDTAEVSPSSSSIFRDSLSPIKGFHGLNKPDVMLEIPTQELIDIDMTDLSMNLDQSDVIDGHDIDENIEKELEDDKTIDASIAEDATEKKKSVDNIPKVVDDTVKQSAVDIDTVNTETNADKVTTAIEESVDQETIATKAAVDEVPTEIEKIDDKKEKSVDESTVEDIMEKMFASDVSEVAKVPECIASTSGTLEQPSTSSTQMTPDTSDEVPEVSDSLGLLAESTGRSMEDDEDDDDGDDDDDFDQDESSNQVSAEQSEDSNPAALETGPVTETEDKELETPEPKESQFPFLQDSYSLDKGHLGYGTLELQAETITEINEESDPAVEALMDIDSPVIEPAKAPKETAEPMDIETVKLSDTSDNETDVDKTVAEPSKEVEEKQKKSPSKSPSKSSVQGAASPKLFLQLKDINKIKQPGRTIVSIVDLEGSSSSDEDVQETGVQKQPSSEPQTRDDSSPSLEPDSQVTSVNIPTGIDIMCTSGGTTSEITTKGDGEAVISGLPKPPPHKPARLNTSEVSIKTVSATEPMVIPETTMTEQNQASTQSKPTLSLEIFNLDSDEEDNAGKELEKPRGTSKCINYSCPSDNTVPCRAADATEVAYYVATKRKRPLVCQLCAAVVADRTKNLIQGVKDLTPLLDLDMRKSPQELVEISDSDSEDDDMSEEPKPTIGKEGAKIVESSLSKFLNDTWKKYKMDARLKEAQIMLDDEIEKLEQDSKDLDEMLHECQVATDKLRNDLYATFEFRKEELPPLIIQDTPEKKYVGPEETIIPAPAPETITIRQAKRRLSTNSIELPAKRPAIPLGYAPLDSPEAKQMETAASLSTTTDTKIDDDKDISVVKLSAEAAPAELPPPGEISRPPLRVGMPVFAMKNAFGPFLKGKVLEIQPKNPSGGNPFSLCRVRFDHKPKSSGKVLPARSIAYAEPADVRMTIGTRLIALFKDLNKRESFYSGVVAEIPNPVNNYRYLVFFDDGYAQYVSHQHTRLVCESSHLVWDEVHPFSRDFVHEYLLAYPERPMVRLHTGQHLKTEWNGKWWPSKVLRVDASLAQVMFLSDGRREWIYRGSTRLAPLYLELQAAERHRVRPMPRSKAQPRSNMPYVEYIRSDEQERELEAQALAQQQMQQQQLQREEEIRRQRAVAKKSTAAPPQTQIVSPAAADPVSSRVVYYTPKNAVKPLKMVPHKCSTKCKRSDILSLKELRTYNPLAKPLLSGWERQIVRYKGHKDVMYRAPCGRRIRNMYELHSYLRATESDLPVDLFDFHYLTHCLAEFILSKCLVMKKDLSHGKENVPVPCVNYFDDSLPEFCSYNTERTPTAGVPLNLEPEFLCGCDCTDDCQDKSKCACWKMTLEGARTIGLVGNNVGYAYKRLPEPLPSGIYECNSRCKCKHTCLNRVAQHPLQLKLQVFKTPNRGWGIRALNDVPKGSFLCVYAGNLLTDATANLDGLNEGDEYLAELDYIEVVEQMKEGYEEDIPDADKKLDKKEKGKEGEESSESSSSSEDEETASKTDKEDDDFRPAFFAGPAPGVTEFNKRLRKREKSKKDKEKAAADYKDKEKDATKDKEPKEGNGDEDCITISDDDEVRVPSSFMAQTNMGANEYISKYKSVRTLFGKDEACYIMDAKVQGNIGRYLNHSCCPNVFVQNVFVDTHDPRFPWVAFFALSHIKAGSELTWNYNYDVGSVPGKVLYCFCGAVNCRGRLL